MAKHNKRCCCVYHAITHCVYYVCDAICTKLCDSNFLKVYYEAHFALRMWFAERNICLTQKNMALMEYTRIARIHIYTAYHHKIYADRSLDRQKTRRSTHTHKPLTTKKKMHVDILCDKKLHRKRTETI